MSLATELQAIIDKISEDEILLYTFVNGDINTVVNGAGGPYPSLAKLTSDLSTAYTKQEVDDFLALKATLESPALTGNPTAPTQSPLDNSTKIATTAYVDSSVGPSDKGFFLTEAALVAEYPTGQDGWYAVVGETDTVWTWDSDTTAWKNTDTNSQGTVTSIGITDGNGITSSGGPVTLSGDITVGLDTATQSTLASVADKAPIADPTFTGTATIPTADITTANTTTANITTGNITTGNITTANITTADFNAGATGGELSWNNQERTLNLVTGADTTIQVGQETVMYCRNKTGTDILNGQVVKIVGAQGDTPDIELAIASNAEEAHRTLGVATQTISANSGKGFITLVGKVRGLDLRLLNGFTEGGLVYLSDTTAGALTPIKPEIEVEIGHALRLGQNNGTLGVFINNEASVYELEQTVPHNTDSVIICNQGDNIQDKYDEAALLTGNTKTLIVMAGTYGNVEFTDDNFFPAVNIIGIGNPTLGSIIDNATFVSTNATYRDFTCNSFFLNIAEGNIENITTTSSFTVYEAREAATIKDITCGTFFKLDIGGNYGTIKNVTAATVYVEANYGTVDNANATNDWYHLGNGNTGTIKNCSGNPFLEDLYNDGIIDNCHSTGTAPRAFGGNGVSENNGTIKNCTAKGNGSFGQQNALGVTENCTAGLYAFASNSNKIVWGATSGVYGTYKNCTAGLQSFFARNFDVNVTRDINATYIGCKAGDKSFGFLNSSLSSTSFKGKAINCEAGIQSFVAALNGTGTIEAGAIIENCTAGDNSFGKLNSSNDGAILRCRAGQFSFANSGTGVVRLCLDENFNEVNIG